MCVEPLQKQLRFNSAEQKVLQCSPSVQQEAKGTACRPERLPQDGEARPDREEQHVQRWRGFGRPSEKDRWL